MTRTTENYKLNLVQSHTHTHTLITYSHVIHISNLSNYFAQQHPAVLQVTTLLIQLEIYFITWLMTFVR